MNKDRVEWVDISKGIGILLVIIGHCVFFGGYIHNWIFSFHMPLFFFLSGFFFKDSPTKVFFVNKSNQLLKPYFLFCLVGTIISLLIPNWRIFFTFRGVLKDIYLGNPDTINVSSIWFLVCMFFTMAIFHLIIQLQHKNSVLSYIVLGIFIIFGFLCGSFPNILSFLPFGRLPFDLDCACVALLFLSSGYYFRNIIFKLVKKIEIGNIIEQIILLLVSFGFTIILTSLNGRVNLHGMNYNNWLLYIVESFVGIFFVIVLSVVLLRNNYAKDIAIWFGRNSLKIMGVQAIYIRLFVLILNYFLGEQYHLYFIPAKYIFIDCVFSIVFSGMTVTLINIFIKRVKFRTGSL